MLRRGKSCCVCGVAEHQAALLQLKRECKEELERMHVSNTFEIQHIKRTTDHPNTNTSGVKAQNDLEAFIFPLVEKVYVVAVVSPGHKRALRNQDMFECSSWTDVHEGQSSLTGPEGLNCHRL